jgi:uncharacterized protein
MPWDFWLIFLVLGVVIPWRGRVRLRRLLSMPAFATKDKLILYGSTIVFQWVLVVLVVWRCSVRGLTLADLGFSQPLSSELLFLTAAGSIFLGSFQWFNLRRVSRMSGPIPDFMRKLAERVLPAGKWEFLPYCALAVTAGICEEILYRGFAMSALSRVGISSWAVVILTSILFGFAHTYQGRSGVVGTGLMGLAFGTVRVVTASLFPVMVWHTVVDLVAGIAGPKYFGQKFESS